MATKGIDYSKWDKMDFSDESGEEEAESPKLPRRKQAPGPPDTKDGGKDKEKGGGNRTEKAKPRPFDPSRLRIGEIVDIDSMMEGMNTEDELVVVPGKDGKPDNMILNLDDESRFKQVARDGKIVIDGFNLRDGNIVIDGLEFAPVHPSDCPPNAEAFQVGACFHGSTKENFEGEFQERMEEYIERVNAMIEAYRRGDTNQDINAVNMQFFRDYPDLAFRSDNIIPFSQHAFAWSASMFLRGDETPSLHGVKLALFLHYVQLPHLSGESESKRTAKQEKCQKWIDRITGGRRGQIMCLARHLTCDCFEGRKATLRLGEKVDACDGCLRYVPTKDLKICSKCGIVEYCSKECQSVDWPIHKRECKEIAKAKERANLLAREGARQNRS